MGTGDIEARLRRLEDRCELRELTLRYCQAMDGPDWDAVAATFAAGARLGEVTGRAEVVGVLRSIRSGYGRTIHTPHGQVLEFTDDDHATGMVPAHAELDIGGQTVVCAMRYLDTYVREDGRWRFAERDIRFSYALPWDQLGRSLTDEFPVHWPGTGPAPAAAF